MARAFGLNNFGAVALAAFGLGGCQQHGPASASHPAGPKCAGSEPILLRGQSTGYARCSTGARHRIAATSCPSLLPREGDGTPWLSQFFEGDSPGSSDVRGSCQRDSDCSARPHGYCGFAELPPARTSCVYGCVRDEECAQDHICLCADPVGHCVPADCRTDAECGRGYLCADYEPPRAPCGTRDAFACQTPWDTCLDSCANGAGLCLRSSGRRTCSGDCYLP